MQIRFADSRIEPDTIRVDAGVPVSVVVSNRDTNRHEFVVGRDELNGMFRQPLFRGIPVTFSGPALTAEPAAHNSPLPGSAADAVHADVAISLAPGQSAGLTMIVPASRGGVWQIACFIPGHTERGVLIVH